MQDYKDGSRLQFIKFDFVTGGQEIKVTILVDFGEFLFIFQEKLASLKQAPGHNHENTMYQPGECALKNSMFRQSIMA